MKLKKALYLTHRWLGIGMCLFFAMWFFSGVVMMYVAFPELTEEERYAGLTNLQAEKITVSAQDIISQVAHQSVVAQFSLRNIAGRPTYILNTQGQSITIAADTGEITKSISSEQAISSANAFYHADKPNSSVTATYQNQVDLDQWSVSSGLNSHRPLHLISMNDRAQTQLYVSSVTGEVVRDTSKTERAWNWVGANLHWIYPVVLRKHGSVWANLIIFVSLIGLLSIITGAIIGFQRLRIKRRYRNNAITPYNGVDKYHHILGLIVIIFLTTFMFSGLMSMSPWGLFDSNTSYAEQRYNYRFGVDTVPPTLAYSDAEKLQRLLFSKQQTIKEIRWHWIQGVSYVTLHKGTYDVSAASDVSENFQNDIDTLISTKIDQAKLNLLPYENIKSTALLENYDSYYYSHHNRFRPLPVLRIKFSDAESTWFHIDTKSGQLIGRLTNKDRIYRWLYNGLHSLDFNLLIKHRPLWDIVMISLCSIGFLFSLTSVLIAWRRLNKNKLRSRTNLNTTTQPIR